MGYLRSGAQLSPRRRSRRRCAVAAPRGSSDGGPSREGWIRCFGQGSWRWLGACRILSGNAQRGQRRRTARPSRKSAAARAQGTLAARAKLRRYGVTILHCPIRPRPHGARVSSRWRATTRRRRTGGFRSTSRGDHRAAGSCCSWRGAAVLPRGVRWAIWLSWLPMRSPESTASRMRAACAP
jgi:hypothetical protein